MNEYLETIREYCKKNNLSLEKLDNQEQHLIYELFILAQPIEIENSDGLKTDLATQPRPTLIYHVDTGEIEETEYTTTFPGIISFKGLKCHSWELFEEILKKHPINKPILSPAWVIE